MRRNNEIKIIDVAQEQIAFQTNKQININIKRKKQLSPAKIVVLIVVLILSSLGYLYLDRSPSPPIETPTIQNKLHPQATVVVQQYLNRSPSPPIETPTIKNKLHPQATVVVQQSNTTLNQPQLINEQVAQSKGQISINKQVQQENDDEQFATNQSQQQNIGYIVMPDQPLQSNINQPQYKQFPNRAISSYTIKRKNSYQQIIAAYKKQNQHDLYNHLIFYNISIPQFMRALLLMQHAPLDTLAVRSSPQQTKLRHLDQQQGDYYQQKYGISRYQQLPMCIVVPTYNNYKRYRYYFNVHSILQQHYSKYRVIIIDDASTDGTATNLQQQLKFNIQTKKRVILMKNTKREYHMANFNTAIRQHCRRGQILVTIDGDDQLIGRYVFKLINAEYHRTKSMAIYSNHIQSKRQAVFDIGISNAYPQQAKLNNQYRQKAHLYSHLRTTWVDLFLLIKQADMKNSGGKWFNNAVDNAIFYPIFEMSCGQVQYLAEILYKYNTFTGQNVDNMPYWMRKQTNDDINAKQKYRCVKEWNRQTYNAIKGYLK